MPESYKSIDVNLELACDEYSKIQSGLIPHQMEDRWFIYFDKGKLYCHRSWTGCCIYVAHFHSKDEKHILTRIDVNNNKDEYEPKSDFCELKNFNNLVELIIEGYTETTGVRQFRKETALEIFEQELCKYYEDFYSQIKEHYSYLLENTKINLRKSNVTKAIILRLKTYYETQDKIVKFINKKSVSPASDFFVETVAFYLKLLLEQRKKNVSVKSEVRFNTEKGKYIKPDISIWRGNKVLAIIECKTNLGFARKRWEVDFKERKRQLKMAFPKAKAYLLVLSSKNWSGFNEDDERVNSQFFALSNTGKENLLLSLSFFHELSLLNE